MGLLDKCVSDKLEEKAKNFKKILDSLQLLPKQRKQLINGMKALYESYEGAMRNASTLPATGECSDYAEYEAKDIFNKYVK